MSEQTTPPTQEIPTPKVHQSWIRGLGMKIVMGILFVFLPFIQVPIIWMIKIYSLRTRIILSIAGSIYTILLFWLGSQQDVPQEISQNTQTQSQTTAAVVQTNSIPNNNQPKTQTFRVGFFGPKVTVLDGVASVNFEFAYTSEILGGDPRTVPNDYDDEVDGAVWEIASNHSEINTIKVGISTTLPGYDYEDQYGKTHPIKSEYRTGYFTVTDLSEIRKYTKEAFLHEHAYSSYLARYLYDNRVYGAGYR